MGSEVIDTLGPASGAVALTRHGLNINALGLPGNRALRQNIDGANMARTKGAKGIGEAERRLIRIAVEAGEPIAKVAAGLGRSRVSVWRQIKAMEARGDMRQAMLPLSDGASHGEK